MDIHTLTKSDFLLLSNNDRYKILKDAFIDVLDGNSEPYDIHASTGLPMKRCEEISHIFSLLG